MVAINARISDQLSHSLTALAVIMERSKSYIIGKAIERYIKEELEDVEDARAALESLNDLNQKFYTSDEVDKILESRLQNEEWLNGERVL